MNANQKPHEFDALTNWSQLTDQELAAVASGTSIELLRQIAGLLLPVEETRHFEINSDNFVPVARAMRSLYEEGSRALGDAIVAAGELADRGDRVGAVSTYLAFLTACRSPFYVQIAQSQIERLKNA